ncbi:MAG: polyphenol oxidase family protein [Planctomycetota bacterium]
MLRECIHPGGWLTLVSPKLEKIGVPHGFTTAIGPGSKRWSVKSAEDLRGVLADTRLDDRAIAMGRQVHGAGVTTPESRGRDRCDGHDAHVTTELRELVAVRTADCVPILLATTDGEAVAAVHAGWRGLEAGVIDAALKTLALLGNETSMVAAIGPCIGVAAYEVGEEVASRFEHGVVRRDDWPRPHLDLRALSLRQLLEGGLPPERIDAANACTFAESERFGSYRRDGKGCAHQAAYIGRLSSS